jgi:hypothetical protein
VTRHCIRQTSTICLSRDLPGRICPAGCKDVRSSVNSLSTVGSALVSLVVGEERGGRWQQRRIERIKKAVDEGTFVDSLIFFRCDVEPECGA